MVKYVQRNKVLNAPIEALIDLISTGTVLPHDDEGKKAVSRYADRLPLYDISTDHVYLIHWLNVFERIYEHGYRIVDKDFFDDLASLPSKNSVQQRNYNILQWYDFDILNETFFQIFYQSFVTHSYITHCAKPSYDMNLPHIKPYYNSSELNYLGLDWGLIKHVTLEKSELNSLCKSVRAVDFTSQTLVDHQFYIYKSKAIGLVKHYSLYGSYFMNLYLRKAKHDYKNPYLERQIEIMQKLISKAPSLGEKEHILYRFVQLDSYLTHLKPGDVYRDPSFMSTTRNPFYSQENGAFGFILIKIIVPGNVKGVGLCIESYSNFPTEEEIVLAPGSEYEFIGIDEPTELNKVLKVDFQKRYTFKWLRVGKQRVIESPLPPKAIVDLKTLITDDLQYMSVADRIEALRAVSNPLNQFVCLINKKEYTFVIDSYRSTTTYKPFFYYETNDGLMITTANPKYGNINLLIEIGKELSVNYYFRYSVTDVSEVTNLDTPWWMEWLSVLAYVLGTRYVIIHSNYILKDDKIKSVAKTRYTFSQNIYEYMTKGKRMYDYSSVTPNFDYRQLDMLRAVKVSSYIYKEDRNELYRIWQESGEEYLFGFYLHVIDNYPRFIELLESKMSSVYEEHTNPFTHVSYTLDAWLYLLDNDIVKNIPDSKPASKGSFKKLIGDKKIPLFKNRLRIAQTLSQ